MERLQKAKEEKERKAGMFTRGVPKPKNPTTLAQLPPQEDNSSSSLLGIGALPPQPVIENQEIKKPAATGIGKGISSITDVNKRKHERLGITPAPAFVGVSRQAPLIIGFF